MYIELLVLGVILCIFIWQIYLVIKERKKFKEKYKETEDLINNITNQTNITFNDLKNDLDKEYMQKQLELKLKTERELKEVEEWEKRELLNLIDQQLKDQ